MVYIIIDSWRSYSDNRLMNIDIRAIFKNELKLIDFIRKKYGVYLSVNNLPPEGMCIERYGIRICNAISDL